TALAGFHPDARLAAAPIWVACRDQQAARRVLNLGLRFMPEVEVFAAGRRQRARTDAGICHLLLQDAQSESDFFAQLYGFKYETDLHRGARDMLYHRMRERLGSAGQLVRENGTVRIEPRRPFAVPEPRWAPSPESAVLSVVARLGQATPREAADALGLPLRTAQHVLRALADDGVCRLHREGRTLRYELQDTTFVEPTQQTKRFAQVAKDVGL
ncbi:MAG: helix-turn-helix transcriptional regulator, partial [Myxococcota bacterium]